MNHVARKKLPEAKLKKAFRIKPFELCKTRAKKSSPDLFKFYVTSAGHDMAIDAGRATTCRRKIQSPMITNRTYKKEGPCERKCFNGGTDWRFQTKKLNNSTLLIENKTKEAKDLKGKIEHEPCRQEGINWSKIEKKSIQNKTVGNLQD